MKIFARSILAGLATSLVAGAALAAGTVSHKDVDFSFEGPFGTFDRAATQRGFQVYREVCSSCHGLKYLAFRNLTEIGYSEEMAKAIAAEYQITDGPDDNGDMFERPGRLSDYVPSPFPNDNAAKAANGGALPPDLSVIVDAREGGADYVYSILTGYEDAPAGEELPAGQYYNAYFPGHRIAMPQPLYEDLVTYADGTPASIEQMAHDVTTFLAWVSEPNLEAQKRMGLNVLLYLAVFTVLLWLTNRKVWRRVKKEGYSPYTDEA